MFILPIIFFLFTLTNSALGSSEPTGMQMEALPPSSKLCQKTQLAYKSGPIPEGYSIGGSVYEAPPDNVGFANPLSMCIVSGGPSETAIVGNVTVNNGHAIYDLAPQKLGKQGAQVGDYICMGLFTGKRVGEKFEDIKYQVFAGPSLVQAAPEGVKC
ncbi:hypothetical protein T439DRAFT_353872 [Meredithblackwellia eburnea MCA 4105]